MVIEISVAIIAAAVVVLVVFLVMALLQTKKTLEVTKRDVHHVSIEAVEMMRKIDLLTSDIKSKADSLNFVFRPLKALNKERSHKEQDALSEVIEWVTIGLVLFNKIKTAVKHHEK